MTTTPRTDITASERATGHPADEGSRHRRSWPRRILSHPNGVIGSVVILAVLGSAALSLFWTPVDPFLADPFDAWAGPSAYHLLGTDGAGRDIFSRLLTGARTTVLVTVGTGALAAVLGIVLAASSSGTHRWLHEPVVILVDVLIAFPTVLAAMMLAAVFGGSLTVVIVAVGAAFGVNVARVCRGEIRKVYGTDYVLAARACGVTAPRVLLRHVLPNIAPVFIIQISLAMAVAPLAEAGLSYLGFGASPATSSWGVLLSQVQEAIAVYPAAVLWPGITIAVTVLGLSLFGDALREATDPRQLTDRTPKGGDR